MEITGRLTADAKVSETKSNKKVVNFNLAINDGYKSKDGDYKKITTYVDCAYWRNAGITQYLKKGLLVALYGRIGASAWTDRQGNPKANITFHINDLKFLGKSTGSFTERVQDNPTTITPAGNTEDDLPF